MNKIRMILTIFLLTTAFITPINSQDLKIKEETGKYSSGNVITFDSFKKDTLFKRTYRYLYKKYPETGQRGTYINASSNKIEASQYFVPAPEKFPDLTNLRIGFTVTYRFKDKWIGYNFSDLYYFSSGDGKVPFDSQKFKLYDTLIRDKLLAEANQFMKVSVKDLKNYLQKSDSKRH